MQVKHCLVLEGGDAEVIKSALLVQLKRLEDDKKQFNELHNSECAVGFTLRINQEIHAIKRILKEN